MAKETTDPKHLRQLKVAEAAKVGGLLGLTTTVMSFSTEVKPAQATIVYKNTPVTSSGSATNWNIDATGAKEGYFFASFNRAFLADSAIPAGTSRGITFLVSTVGPTPAKIKKLGAGVTIPAGSANFNGNIYNNFWNSAADTRWNGASGFYFGFKFNLPTIGIVVGWAKATRTGNNLTINDWAYNNTTGGSIVTGDTGVSAVPFEVDATAGLATLAVVGGAAALRRRLQEKQVTKEISGAEGMGLLAAGAAGIREWRERKQLRDTLDRLEQDSQDHAQDHSQGNSHESSQDS
jgi:hypothetical protein